ncbi:pectinesterase inhibitor 6 [Silene latifolia]|uniref:pectinesterase inhibitor 6 n=1 Tax=Silene latifolia TaxID=37657 RepID=UPI003D772557
MTRLINIFGLIIFLSCILLQVYAQNYVQQACSVTRYQKICLKTLASYSNKARRSPSRWARAAVSVTIGDVKVVAEYINNVNRYSHVSGRRNKAALLDCVENVQDTLNNLHKSLDVLRSLSYSRFEEQMSDILTWLSAALTDLDTCIDGFEGRKGRLIGRLCYKVQNSSFITSNALALANKLATTGLQDLGGDP